MAISLEEVVERLEWSLLEMEKCNYGDAAQRLSNTIQAIKNNGIQCRARLFQTSKQGE